MICVVIVVIISVAGEYIYDMWEQSGLDNFENNYHKITRIIMKKNGITDSGIGNRVVVYIYNGKLVFTFPVLKCSDCQVAAYDVNGKKLGSPIGGITGRGDGSMPDFMEKSKLIAEFDV